MSEIITDEFLEAILAVEQGPEKNPYNFTESAWADAMEWRRRHNQETWPYNNRGDKNCARDAARALCELNQHRLATAYDISMPEDVHECRALLYGAFWKGCEGFVRGLDERARQRCENVANYADKLETA